MVSRIRWRAIVPGLAVCCFVQPGLAGEPGLVDAPAAGERSVAVEGRHLVAYEETIPGTTVKFTMIPVPGGEFLMGSPAGEAGRGEDEGPQVKVTVAPFWIGRCEVTWAEYRAYMDNYEGLKSLHAVNASLGEKSATDENAQLIRSHVRTLEDWDANSVDAVSTPTPLYDPSFTYGVGEAPEQPAVTMTQFAARQYAKWLSGLTNRQYRLPSEAEWEYAARAGTTTPYSFGADEAKLTQYAWYDANGEEATHPVGKKAPNPWGLYDMHGNVAEWTLDGYDAGRYAALGAGPVAAAKAVHWPVEVYPRSIRGGSWLLNAAACRSAARQASEEDEWKLSDPNFPSSPWWYTEEPAAAVGMRIVRPLEPMNVEEQARVWDADVDPIREDVKMRLEEGRGVLGAADPQLPAAIEAAKRTAKP